MTNGRMQACCLAVSLLAGCGNSANPDMGTDGPMNQQTCQPDGKTIALAPKYGVQANLNVNVKAPAGCTNGCIVNTDATSKLLLLAQITQNGTTATVTTQPCLIDIPKVPLAGGNKPIVLTAPSALVQSVKAVTSSGTLDSPNTCANFTAQPITITLGTHLANPSSDPLPTYMSGSPTLCGGSVTTACETNTTPPPSDTGCVCDQDGDGKPGGTLDAMNVPALTDLDRIYVDLRTQVTLNGQVFPQASGQTNPGPRILGKVGNLALEQNVLGCHLTPSSGAPSDCNSTQVALAAGVSPAVSQSANADSTFIAVPLSASDTCETLIANETALFQ